MKILITGATGYFGHQLALTLAQQGNCVHILVRNPASPNIPQHPNIHVFTGDITRRNSITLAMKNCERVFHTAALVKIWSKNPAEFYTVNVDGTNNVLAEALELGIKKLVFTSSCAVLGASLKEPLCETDPRLEGFDNDYDFSKFMAENIVKEYGHKGLFTAIVCPSKIYGPGIDTHPITVNKVIRNFISNKFTFIPKPGSLIANYCFINDVVQGHLLAMEKGLGGEKYILGGENISYTDFFELLRSLSNAKSRLIQAPRFIVTSVAWLKWLQCTISNKDLFFSPHAVRHIFCNKSFSSGKAIRQLGYQLTPLKEGLQQTIHFLKNQNHV
ncbi:MAG: NAD-dependent epimerase/dehydratase family protein [Chitinophagaceae bacterium]|nr:NAD-dependent epimerase/dehydratase family protein [Chitinophagaceae bacterium]